MYGIDLQRSLITDCVGTRHGSFPTVLKGKKTGYNIFRLKANASSRPSGLSMCSLTTLAPFKIGPQDSKEKHICDIKRYDAHKQSLVDLVVVGSGPAGLAVAKQVSAAGAVVCCIDPSPQSVWPNNYGVWVDEFEAMDLLDCLDSTWPFATVYLNEDTKKCLKRPYGRVDRRRLKEKMLEGCITNGVMFHEAKALKVEHERECSYVRCSDGQVIKASVVMDATGFSQCFVQYDKPYNPGYQIAYGIVAEVDSHPFAADEMVLMDWRDSHLHDDPILRGNNHRLPTFLYAMPFSSNRIFLEETSLVGRPGVPMEEIRRRMVRRLAHLDINVKGIEEDEVCIIPMGGPLPVLAQRVVGIGGTAGLVHPSTGYMVARTLAAAGTVANAIVQRLGNKESDLDELSAGVWKDLWPKERRQQREYFCFGMDVLLALDLDGTRRFFEVFFDLEPYQWQGFLSSRLSIEELFALGFAMFARTSNASRLEVMVKSAVPFATMLKNLACMKDF